MRRAHIMTRQTSETIYQIGGESENPSYIVVSAGRASSREGGLGAHLLTVKDGKLIKLKAFEYEGEMLYSMGVRILYPGMVLHH